MSRTLTASDRSALIRLASTMPVGSAERRAILAGLTNRVGRKVRLDEFVSAFADGDTQLFGPLVSVSAWADAMRAAGAEEYNGFVLDDVASWLAHWGVQAVHPAREFSVALYFKLPPKVPLTKFFRGGNGSCDEFSTMRGGPDGGTQLDAGWYNKPPYAATAAAVAEGAEVWVRMWWD